MINKTDWTEQFKIRIANPDESMMKHDVIKLLIVRKLILKNKKDKNFIHVYTEHELDNGLIADIYFENNRTKEAFAYEVQKTFSKEWLHDRTEKYREWTVYGMNSSDWIPVPIKEAPSDLNELSKWLDKFIF